MHANQANNSERCKQTAQVKNNDMDQQDQRRTAKLTSISNNPESSKSDILCTLCHPFIYLVISRAKGSVCSLPPLTSDDSPWTGSQIDGLIVSQHCLSLHNMNTKNTQLPVSRLKMGKTGTDVPSHTCTHRNTRQKTKVGPIAQWQTHLVSAWEL